MRRPSFLSLTPLLPVLLVLLAACNVVNTSHCGNREGDATCAQRAPTAPYCNICIADNDGCVADRPTDLACLATTAAPPTTSSSSTAEPTTTLALTTLDPTTLDPTTTTTTLDPTTTTTTTTTTIATTTTETSTTDASTTGDPGTTTDTTTGDPICGNNIVEGDEVCDGSDLNDTKCIHIAQGKYGGGKLACTRGCESFDDTNCCLGVGISCNSFDSRCCGGLKCAPPLVGSICQVQ